MNTYLNYKYKKQFFLKKMRALKLFKYMYLYLNCYNIVFQKTLF